MVTCDFCGLQGVGKVGKINVCNANLDVVGAGQQPLLANPIDCCDSCLAKFKARVQGLVNDMKGNVAELALLDAKKKQLDADAAKASADKAAKVAADAAATSTAPPPPVPPATPTPPTPAPHTTPPPPPPPHKPGQPTPVSH